MDSPLEFEDFTFGVVGKASRRKHQSIASVFTEPSRGIVVGPSSHDPLSAAWSKFDFAKWTGEASTVVSGLRRAVTPIQHTPEGVSAVRLKAIEQKVSELAKRVDAIENAADFLAVLNSLESAKYRLRKAITLVIDPDDSGLVVAHWDDALLEGEGENVLGALQAIREEIVLAYEDCASAVDEGLRLEGYPARLWSLLREFVSKIDAAS
jgi:hypothetical protein